MDPMEPITLLIWAVSAVIVVLLLGGLATRFLTTVPAGTIRIVSWWGGGGMKIYKGPGKAWEVPFVTTTATIPSQAINIDLDIHDQTADRDAQGVPRPIKVNVQASAIVAVGDTHEAILTAANRFFSKDPADQLGTLTDLLTSSGRRAINLLKHDQLFSSTAGPAATALASVEGGASLVGSGVSVEDEDEDPLAIIIKRQCSREMHDLGLTFKSLNIKAVGSEVAEARRRQSAVEAKANADIVQAEQERRAQEARLTAMQQISDKERELERRRAENAAQVAQAEALRQDAVAVQRAAELRATVIAQATADAERAKVEAQGQAEAERVRLATVASGEAERIRILAHAQAEGIAKVNEAIARGGEGYLRLKQLEMLPQVAPDIARALGQARIVNISGDGHAAEGATGQITGVLQTILAAQLLKEGLETRVDHGQAPGEPVLPPRPAEPVPVGRARPAGGLPTGDFDLSPEMPAPAPGRPPRPTGGNRI
jgi:flotillin